MTNDYRFELYEYAVEHPGESLDAAAGELGLTAEDIETARDELVEMQLLQRVEPSGAYRAVSPDIAVTNSVQDDLVRINDLTRSVERVRSQLAEVEPRYAAASQRRLRAYTPVEVLEDPTAVRRVIRNSTYDCHKWAYILYPNVSLRAESHRASAIFDREMVQRGVDRRNLYHDAALTNTATQRSVAELTPLGVQFRVTPVVPIQALIYDENLAILSRRSAPDDKAAIVIRDPDLVGVVLLLYRALWDMASPFPVDQPEAESEGEQLSEQQRRLLQGLAAGHTDESIARRLGVHVRTLRRHISDLSAQTGADSRFQLALLARDRGWL